MWSTRDDAPTTFGGRNSKIKFKSDTKAPEKITLVSIGSYTYTLVLCHLKSEFTSSLSNEIYTMVLPNKCEYKTYKFWL